METLANVYPGEILLDENIKPMSSNLLHFFWLITSQCLLCYMITKRNSRN